MLNLSLNVSLLAPLGMTEDELVNGLCAKLRTLATDPARVQREMQGGLTLTAATSEEWQRQLIDVLGLFESDSAVGSDLKSTSRPAEEAPVGMCAGSSADADTSADAAQASTEGTGGDAGVTA